MATKSKGRGGARPGAGRKLKAAAPDPAELEAAAAMLASRSAEELMELAVRVFAVRGRWDEVSKAGARLAAARARSASAAPGGVKQQRQAAADGVAKTSRFAPPPPPPKPN